jgi:hypothetical protein
MMKNLIKEILLKENRIKKVEDKYKDCFDDVYQKKVLQYFVSKDFMKNTNQKYLDWVVNVWCNGGIDIGYDDLINYVALFDENRDKFKNKDLYQYKNWDVFENEVKEIEGEKHKKWLESNVKNIFEDEDYLVIQPITYESSCKYGGGTKWCTASKKTDTHFNQYTDRNHLVYVIDKHKKQKHPLYKTAILMTKTETSKDTGVSVWNAPDHKILGVSNGIGNLTKLYPKDLIDSLVVNFFDDGFDVFLDRFLDDYLSELNGSQLFISYDEEIYADVVIDDRSGVVYYHVMQDEEMTPKPKFLFNILATPNWEDTGEIPIDYEIGDDYRSYTNIKIPKILNKADLEEWFNRNYIDRIYEIADEILKKHFNIDISEH